MAPRPLKRSSAVLGPMGSIKRSTVYNNSMAVQKLDRKLKAYRRQDTEWTQYQIKTTASPTLSTKYIWHLTKVADWTERFGITPAGVPFLHKIDYDLYFKTNDEAGPTTFTVFIVSLRGDTQTQLTENQGTDLQSGLVENVHYITGEEALGGGLVGTSGQVHLNPAFFRVHKRKDFALGEEGFYAGMKLKNMSDSGRRFTGSIKHHKKLVNGRGDFDPAGMSTINNSAKLFLIVFTNNASGLEGSPILDGTCMVTVKST